MPRTAKKSRLKQLVCSIPQGLSENIDGFLESYPEMTKGQLISAALRIYFEAQKDEK